MTCVIRGYSWRVGVCIKDVIFGLKKRYLHILVTTGTEFGRFVVSDPKLVAPERLTYDICDSCKFEIVA